MFFLSLEGATLVALPPIHDSETACHKNKAVPAPSLPALDTSRLLVSNCNPIPAALVSSRARSRRISSPDFGGPVDAGKNLSNRYFLVSDLIGSRFEMPIALWPSIVDESGLELRP